MENKTTGSVRVKNPYPRKFVQAEYEFRDGFTTLVIRLKDDYEGKGGTAVLFKLQETGELSDLEEWERLGQQLHYP